MNPAHTIEGVATARAAHATAYHSESRKPARKQVDGDRGQRHRGGIEELREAVRERGVLEELERRRQDRLQQRREVRIAAADQRPPSGRERAGERRIDVLVGEVVRRRVEQREQRPNDHRDRDQRAEREPRRRADERVRERPQARAWKRSGDVDGHGGVIGSARRRLKPPR